MQKPLLILLTGDPVLSAQAKRGDFGALIRNAIGAAWTGPWSVLDLRLGPQLPTPSELAAVVVSGSPAMLRENTDWMRQGMNYLGRLVEDEVPTLGVCFGHQMLGQALGGRVEKNPRGREIGTVELRQLGASPLLDDLGHPPPAQVNATHVDSIVELPPGATRLAETTLEENAVVQFGSAAWGVQFHPEIDQEVMGCYLRERREVLLAEGIDADGLLSSAADAPHGRMVLQRFVEQLPAASGASAGEA